MGLVNRLVDTGKAREARGALAHELARLPQGCLRSDRLSAYEQWDLEWDAAWRKRGAPRARGDQIGRDAGGSGTVRGGRGAAREAGELIAAGTTRQPAVQPPSIETTSPVIESPFVPHRNTVIARWRPG
jgi:hypothetical protein